MDLETVIGNFNQSIDRWIGALDNYDNSRLCLQHDADSWSIGQVYIHLIEETGYYFQQCEICLSSRENTMQEMNDAGKKMFQQNRFPEERIQGSANVYNTQQPQSRAAVLTGLLELKKLMNDLGEKIRKVKSNGKTKHPGLGWFSAEDWFRFAEMHIRHHFRQKERIDRFF
jgi:hypothetical protein